ncbi:MAG: serine/threonine-protein kinase [Actinomycetota bacterium]
MTSVPGYDLEGELGRGGFATVYRATQRSIGRAVAIKLISDPDPPEDTIRRFTRESRAVGALSWHPNIAAVIDAGSTDDGRAFIVFELLSGGSLEDAIVNRPLDWPEAVDAMVQVADAVEAAHRSDVLHRDIKPANILRDRFGKAKLADFGIASMQDGTKTATGAVAVTVAHAPPEVFLGVASTAASDVYALGSTLHNLIAGTAPFAPPPGESLLASIGRIANESPPRLSPSLAPAAVGDVIVTALAKEPAERFSSAGHFGRALQRAQRELGRPVTAMPIVDEDPAESPREPRTPATRVVDTRAEPDWFPPSNTGEHNVGDTVVDPSQTDTADIAEPEWF